MPGPFLIIDLEATCWDGAEKEPHAGQNEIIEIGFAIVSPDNQLLWHGGWFVRPIANPLLSDFCKKLTSIQQTDVDGAPLFPEALQLLNVKARSVTGKDVADCTFVSWGNYDRTQFERDCARHQIPTRSDLT